MKVLYNYQNRENAVFMPRVAKRLISVMKTAGEDIELTCEISAFEKEFASYIGTRHAISTNSGTTALELCLLALGVRSGDEVILPAVTFIATALAALNIGAKVKFCDVSYHNMDPSCLKKMITPKTKAIMPVHFNGYPCDIREICEIAEDKGVPVLEDACQSLGATVGKKMTGSFGDAAAFSFNTQKNLGGYGDGGMMVFKNKEHFENLEKIGMEPDETLSLLNKRTPCRLAPHQVVMLREKFHSLERLNSVRRKIAAYYDSHLSDVVSTPPTGNGKVASYCNYCVLTGRREDLFKFLRSKSITSEINVKKPLPLFKNLSSLGYRKGDFPGAEDVTQKMINLPLSPFLTADEAEAVVKNVRAYFSGRK